MIERAVRTHRHALTVIALIAAVHGGAAGASGEQRHDAELSPGEVRVGSADHAPQVGVDWTIERIERVEKVLADARYRIVNRFGDLRLKGADGDELMVIGVAQYSPHDAVRPVIDVRDIAGAVTVEVRFVDADGDDLGPDEVGKRRVDLAVIVPGTGEAVVESGDGLVDSRWLRNPLEVRSRSGAVRILAADDLDLRSEHGDVEVYFRAGKTIPDLAVETVTGDIRVELPPGIDRTVRARTNGHLMTDVSLTVDRAAGSPHKVAVATLGTGGDPIRLTSTQGTIAILDQPLLVEPESP
jgi:hypothetical protein